MPGYLCGKPVQHGGACLNKVSTPGGPCGANHKAADGPTDLMAALKQSIGTNKQAQTAQVAAADPMAGGPSTNGDIAAAGPVDAEAFKAAKDTAHTGGRVVLAPLRHTRHLAAHQLAGHAKRAEIGAAQLAGDIAGIREADTGYIAPADIPDLDGAVVGTAAYVAGISHTKKATRAIQSAGALSAMTPEERAGRLARAHGHAFAATEMFSRAGQTLGDTPATPFDARTSRLAGRDAVADAISGVHGFSSTPRARRTAQVIHVARQHLTNALAAMGNDQIVAPEFNYDAMIELGPAKCADAALDHLTEARDLLQGESGLSDNAKRDRLKTAVERLYMAEGYADAASDKAS